VSLANSGPSSDLLNVVGLNAFLEVLGDPNFRVRILDKRPMMIKEALRIILNVEALDTSRDA